MGSVEEVLLVADGAENVLDRDDVPNENQSTTCFSCDTPVIGLYCHECGNKNDDYRRSIFRLIVEMFTNITALDSRIWRTLWALIRKPGRVSREFADGARTRWTSPVRLFLAASLLLFGYVSVTETQMMALGQLEGEATVAEPPEADAEDGRVRFPVGIYWFVKRDRLVVPPDGAEIVWGDVALSFSGGYSDGYAEGLRDDLEDIEDDLGDEPTAAEREVLEARRRKIEEELEAIKVLREATTPSAAIGDDAEEGAETADGPYLRTERDGVELGEDDANAVLQNILRNPQVINNQLNTKLKWMMFVMMPLAMLLGAVFIRGRSRAMLYDHLVHAGYIHAFSFLLLFVFILLAQYTPLPGLPLIYAGILLVYLPMSAKGMFGRSDIKSIVTAYGVGAVYSLVMFLAAAMIVALALEEEAVAFNAERATADAPAAPPAPPDPTLDPMPDPEPGPDAP